MKQLPILQGSRQHLNGIKDDPLDLELPHGIAEPKEEPFKVLLPCLFNFAPFHPHTVDYHPSTFAQIGILPYSRAPQITNSMPYKDNIR